MTSAHEHSAQVREAARMVSVQAECTVDEAFVLMQERASVQDLTFDEVAEAVVEGLIRFG